jgi:hypothetical protein
MDATCSIPSSADVRRLLASIPLPRLRELSLSSGVPFGTLYKIAVGETTNPGIETTRRFYAGAVVLASLLRGSASGVDAATLPPVAAGQFATALAAQQEARDAA